MRVFTISLVVMASLVLGSTVAAAAQEYRSHGTWRRDGHRIEVLIEGFVRLTESRDELVAPSPGSRLLLREECPRQPVREIELSADQSGAVQRKYSVDGEAQAMTRSVEQWFRTVLPMVVRDTPEGAEVHLQEPEPDEGRVGSC